MIVFNMRKKYIESESSCHTAMRAPWSGGRGREESLKLTQAALGRMMPPLRTEWSPCVLGLRLLLSEVMVHRSTGRYLRAWGGWSMLAQHGAQPGAQGLDKSMTKLVGILWKAGKAMPSFIPVTLDVKIKVNNLRSTCTHCYILNG